jgi:hypothetical protein
MSLTPQRRLDAVAADGGHLRVEDRHLTRLFPGVTVAAFRTVARDLLEQSRLAFVGTERWHRNGKAQRAYHLALPGHEDRAAAVAEPEIGGFADVAYAYFCAPSPDAAERLKVGFTSRLEHTLSRHYPAEAETRLYLLARHSPRAKQIEDVAIDATAPWRQGGREWFFLPPKIAQHARVLLPMIASLIADAAGEVEALPEPQRFCRRAQGRIAIRLRQRISILFG